MLNVAVCGDGMFTRELEALLRRERRVKRITPYRSAEELAEDMSHRGKGWNTALVDLDGQDDPVLLRCARELYRVAPHISVLYVSAHCELAAPYMGLCEGNLAGLLPKPVDPALLSRYADKLCDRFRRREFLSFAIHGRPFALRMADVYYVESCNHTVVIHTAEASYTIYERLGAVLSRLPEQFVHCHKSYAANLEHVVRLEGDRLRLRDGEIIPISKLAMDATMEAFYRFADPEL